MIKLTSLLQEDDQQTEEQAKQNVINRLSDQSVRKALEILYHYERTGKLPPTNNVATTEQDTPNDGR